MRSSPTDGRPFYCVTCGAGYREYIECERGDCQLEDEEVARARATSAKPSGDADPPGK